MLNEGLENRAGVVKLLTFEKTENIHGFEILFSQPGSYPVERESSHKKEKRVCLFVEGTFPQPMLHFVKDGKCPRGQKASGKPARSLLECVFFFRVRSCYACVASKNILCTYSV